MKPIMISALKKFTLSFSKYISRQFFSRLGTTALLFLLLAAPAMAEQRSGNIYGLPPCVTVSGEKIDFIFRMIFWLTAVVFVLVQGTYITYLIKYRYRPGVKAHYSHGNNKLEIVWTTLPTIIFLALAIYSRLSVRMADALSRREWSPLTERCEADLNAESLWNRPH